MISLTARVGPTLALAITVGNTVLPGYIFLLIQQKEKLLLFTYSLWNSECEFHTKILAVPSIKLKEELP